MTICWRNIILALKAKFKGGVLTRLNTPRGMVWVMQGKVDYIIVAHKLS